MELEEAHLHGSRSGKVIHCSDGIVVDNDGVKCALDGNITNISQEETGDGSSWSLRGLSRRLLQVVDWAGERLASAVGLTDSKFDVYLWEREYLDKEEAEREANTFIIDPT